MIANAGHDPDRFLTYAQHVIDASHEVGVDASVTEAVRRIYTRAIAASDGTGEPVRTYRLIAGAGR